jgi:hypothetical protein
VHVGAEAHVLLQLGVEGVRQQVEPTHDLLHVLERAAHDLTQLLDHRGVHVGLTEAHHSVQLDRALRPAAVLEELPDREPVVVLDDRDERPLPLLLVSGHDILGGLVPQVRVRAAALVLGELERQLVRVPLRLRHGHPLPAHVHQRLGVPHHERPQRQPEGLAVRQRQLVDARDAHRAELRVEPRREAAAGVHASPDAVLGLEQDHVVPRPLQLVRGHEPGDAPADHHHLLAVAGPRLQTPDWHLQDGIGNRRALEWRRLRGLDALVLDVVWILWIGHDRRA